MASKLQQQLQDKEKKRNKEEESTKEEYKSEEEIKKAKYKNLAMPDITDPEFQEELDKDPRLKKLIKPTMVIGKN